MVGNEGFVRKRHVVVKTTAASVVLAAISTGGAYMIGTYEDPDRGVQNTATVTEKDAQDSRVEKTMTKAEPTNFKKTTINVHAIDSKQRVDVSVDDKKISVAKNGSIQRSFKSHDGTAKIDIRSHSTSTKGGDSYRSEEVSIETTSEISKDLHKNINDATY